MRELQSIRRDLKRSLARDFRSQLESLRANAHSDVIDEAMWSEHVAVALQAIEVDWQRKRPIQAAQDRLRPGRRCRAGCWAWRRRRRRTRPSSAASSSRRTRSRACCSTCPS